MRHFVDRTPIIPARDLWRVVVDLTAVLPGGENGGAKVVALELVRLVAQTVPHCEFILLTLARNHGELAALEVSNVKRLQVDIPGPTQSPLRNSILHLRSIARKVLPLRLLDRISGRYDKYRKAVPNSLLRHLGADILFCPFTVSDYYDPSVPLVSIVHDLQHRYHPQFFDLTEVYARERAFREACRVSRYIVCTSRCVRESVLANGEVAPERVEIIPILLQHRLRRPAAAVMEQALRALGLASDGFLLYPANFWRHKNHEALLRAFRLYLEDNRNSNLKLVLTGAPGIRRDLILQICHSDRLLSDHVVCPGYLAEQQFSALLYSCRAIIFPSLFEGFGMPLLEGMAAGKPLLVSDATSLPELAGEAALYFDPNRPPEIADAIARLEQDVDLRRSLAAKATDRLRAFGGPEEMAARYVEVFRAAIN